jgi:RND superfamily putative drug exporter
MLRLTRWTIAHRRLVVVAWVVLAVGVLVASQAVGKRDANNFSLPNTDSQRAIDLLESRFPAQAGDADQIVFHTPQGRITDPASRARIAPVLARIARLPHVTGVISPYASAGGQAISRDGRIAFATVTFDEQAAALPKPAVERVVAAARGGRPRTIAAANAALQPRAQPAVAVVPSAEPPAEHAQRPDALPPRGL